MNPREVGILEKYRGNSIICFLDLLGFSDSIRERWNDEKNSPLDAIMYLEKALSHIVGNGYCECLSIPKLNKLTSTKYSCNLKFISDSMILAIPMHDVVSNDDLQDFFAFIQCLIISIGGVWRHCLDQGYTIRGAIEFSDIYWDDKHILGPALIEAYRLESQEATTSRIICGRNFIRLCVNKIKEAGNELFKNDGKSDTTIKFHEDFCNDLLANFHFDNDGFLCVNPNIMYSDDIGKNMILNQINRLMTGKKDYIKEKYLPLYKQIKKPEELKIPIFDDMEGMDN